MKELNLRSFSRKSRGDDYDMHEPSAGENRDFFFAFKCTTCIRESYLACPFLTSYISKLEIKVTYIQEVCWVKHCHTLTQKV